MNRTLKTMLKTLTLILVIMAFAAIYIWQEFGNNPDIKEQESYKKLSYFQNGEFQSPQKLVYDFDNVRNGKVGFGRFLFKSEFAPKVKLPKIKLDKNSFPKIADDLSIYWLGHSTAIMDLDNKRFIFDPVLGNAAPIPVAVPRYGKAPIKRKELPVADYIVITHNHYDHLEKKTVQSIKNGHFIVPLGVGAALRGWGIDKNRITELGWGQSFKKDGFIITAEEGVHYTNRSPFNRNQTLWNSYIIKSPNKNIFWGGDTGYSEHFARIGKKYQSFDFAALEIDGWNTGWPNTHLFPHEVIKASQDLNAKTILPIHWAVFDLALHPWQESIEMLLDEAKGKDIKILTPKMGEKINLKSNTQHWWKGLQ